MINVQRTTRFEFSNKEYTYPLNKSHVLGSYQFWNIVKIEYTIIASENVITVNVKHVLFLPNPNDRITPFSSNMGSGFAKYNETAPKTKINNVFHKGLFKNP